MIRCREARRCIDLALEQELGVERRLELEAHLARCEACARREREARTLQEWLEGPGDPPPSAPDVEAALQVVLARLERNEAVAPVRTRRVAWVAGLALAAALLALLFVGRRRGPSEEASEELVVGPAGVAAEHDGPGAPSTPGAEVAAVAAVVEAALRACFAGGGLDVERAQVRFLEAVREPLRAGWPVRRFVEQALASADEELACAAVRCLGAGGEPGAALALERALARPELVAEALEALGGLALVPESEAPAVAALERALAVPAQASAALRELCRAGGPRAAASIERAARSGAPLSRAVLLDALTTTGPAAVASLLRLAEAAGGRHEGDSILARLALVDGGGPELARLLQRGDVPADLAYPALAAAQPREAVPWLEVRALESRERGAALATLAAFPGPEPLAAALRLARGGRVPRADVLALLVRLLEGEEERAEPFSRALVARGDGAELAAWLALLIESGVPAAAPALVPLAFAPALGADDRGWAALAVGELGAEREARVLARALEEPLARLLVDDPRLVAAVLVALHAHLGAEGVADALAGALPEPHAVVAALAGDAAGAVRVHRVARALAETRAARDRNTVAWKETQ
ncbi:MAG TPA: hypothetical protein VF530_09765 [Planctomycetota bacterium]